MSGSKVHTQLAELREKYLAQPGVKVWGYRRLYLQAGSWFTCFAVSYALLLLWAHGWWQVILLSLSTIVSLAGFLINTMHDANHGALADRRYGKYLYLTLELVGASSRLWRIKHSEHHGKTNMVGADSDIDLPPLARMAPAQPWRPWYYYQRYYIWLLYGLMALRWFFVGDFQSLHRGTIGQKKLRPFTPGQWTTLLLAKLLAATWMLGIPLWLHHADYGAITLAIFFGCAWTFGFMLSIIFQFAHCIDEALFTSLKDVDSQSLVHFYWDENQALATSNYRSKWRIVNWLLDWFLGGLDHQIEHHLYQNLPHPHLKRLAPEVRRIFEENRLIYISHNSLWSAFVSHYHHLKKMGLPPQKMVPKIVQAAS